MLFTEFRFFLFFALVFALYWSIQSNNWRKVFILAVSYLYYGFWDWRFLSLIMVSTLVDYWAANQMGAARSPSGRRSWLIVSLAVNLGMLGFFKYFNFFADSAIAAFERLGLPVNDVTVKILLPVGISFFVFQAISYVMDVYAGKSEPESNLLNLACYIGFFPQLLAGPITRASVLIPQFMNARKFDQVDIRACLLLFLVGFFKKTCISDNIAPIVNSYYAAPESFTVSSAWMAVLGYAVQIYCDFSGYSDMAIAVAGLLGYQLAQNFDAPYFASSITAFWRRWHISLSNWLRDYLYIPLGGNRGGQFATYRNLMVTMVLGGLWHGAAWTFVIWGALHGFALMVHREWAKRFGERTLVAQSAVVWGVLVTFYWVCVSWVFFRAESFAQALTVLKSFVLLQSSGSEQLSMALLAVFGALALIHWLASSSAWQTLLMRLPNQLFAVGYGAIAALLLTLMPTTQSAFIYFQF
jgi:alginate O-acetyltransferase complex protein AlgI